MLRRERKWFCFSAAICYYIHTCTRAQGNVLFPRTLIRSSPIRFSLARNVRARHNASELLHIENRIHYRNNIERSGRKRVLSTLFDRCVGIVYWFKSWSNGTFSKHPLFGEVLKSKFKHSRRPNARNAVTRSASCLIIIMTSERTTVVRGVTRWYCRVAL